MKELKVKVWNYKNLVIYEVLEMDESLRGEGKIFEASNGFTIISDHSPAIGTNSFYIKGAYEDMDCILDEHRFPNIKKAEEYVKKVKQAVAEYNASIKEILTDKEREWVGKVVEPFKSQIEFIALLKDGEKGYNYLKIAYVNEDDYCEDLVFPIFKEGKYYKNMEIGKAYTLKDLGLEE